MILGTANIGKNGLKNEELKMKMTKNDIHKTCEHVVENFYFLNFEVFSSLCIPCGCIVESMDL